MRLAIVLSLTFVASRAFATACPENTVSAGCWPDAITYSTNLPAAQVGQNGAEAWNSAQPCVNGCYDLPAGKVVAVGYVNTQGGCLGAVQVTDIYTLIGPGNAPVPFFALLQLDTTRPAGGHYSAELAVAGGPSDQISDTPISEVSLSCLEVPGEPFSLSAHVQAYGDPSLQPHAPVIADGTILFALPAGYSIVSCRDYDVPTAAGARTWGQVKALYR